MSDYNKCSICGEYDFMDRHECHPKYEVNHPDYMGDEWASYYGYDHEAAAMKYGEHYNEDGEYELMNNEIIVNVRKFGEDKIIKVAISAEPDVHYSTNIVD